MLRKICNFLVMSAMVFMLSGCGAILSTALSAGAAYGIYMATRNK